ncbi:MAG: ATP-binding cassette domain-containing protein, partial [Caulobacteraceae bacterium]
MSLIVEDIHKRYGRWPALAGASLSLGDGEFLSLLGPSGSGKTTLLRILAGLDRPDAGRVRLNGDDLLRLPARRRRVGLVFQHYTLFRHTTVAANIAFGLDVRPRATRPSRAAIGARVAELIALTRIDGLA